MERITSQNNGSWKAETTRDAVPTRPKGVPTKVTIFPDGRVLEEREPLTVNPPRPVSDTGNSFTVFGATPPCLGSGRPLGHRQHRCGDAALLALRRQIASGIDNHAINLGVRLS